MHCEFRRHFWASQVVQDRGWGRGEFVEVVWKNTRVNVSSCHITTGHRESWTGVVQVAQKISILFHTFPSFYLRECFWVTWLGGCDLPWHYETATPTTSTKSSYPNPPKGKEKHTKAVCTNPRDILLMDKILCPKTSSTVGWSHGRTHRASV